ncbi:PadR family transcriptional regulator [Celerinatantimonas sp. MCCC 1A17872]|uniref:PadR family transcriptional regulator n=1 Tax=Celerinatantimonas sp. MCCC 1A17872 TaxID=3177514 RepID=UPI0038CB9A51
MKSDHSESMPEDKLRKRRSKLFNQFELQLLTLHLIRLNPLHGYGVIKMINEYSQGIYAPSPGVVYPLLTTLYEQGWIDKASDSRSKKAYEVTAQGLAYLEEHKEPVNEVMRKMRKLVQARAPERIEAIVQAMEKLKIGLRSQRLKYPDMSQERIDFIAQTISDAAAKIYNYK